jgi:hypothetical protein
VLLIARNGKIAGWTPRISGAEVADADEEAIPSSASHRCPSRLRRSAIMILAEEGKLDIGAPVAQYLPEFKDVTVGVEKAAPKRPMTVQDLLRHTSGLTYGIFGSSAVDELYKKSNIFASKSLADMVATIAQPAAGAPARRVLGV